MFLITDASKLVGKYTPALAAQLKKASLDRVEIASRGLMYEKLDQLTMELLLGVR